MSPQPHLTIRNLTSTPITLINSSSFPTPTSPSTSSLTSLIIRAPPPAAPTSAALYAHAQQVTHITLNATIPAYTAIPLPLTLKESHTLRLDFTVPTATTPLKFRLDIPCHPKLELPIAPLSGPTQTKLVGLFHHHQHHIAIIPTSDPRTWMAHLPDATPITALSLPGTHNSPTYHRALPSVRCQAVPIRTQLAHGVRFLDIRVQPPSLTLVHGAFPITLRGSRTLASALAECYTFLEAHKSETIIVSLKREGRGNTSDEQFSRLLQSEIVNKHPEMWYTSAALPTLGEARGKCVLFRRFALDPAMAEQHKTEGWGIDAEEWTYNSPNDRYNRLCVQDFCEVLHADTIAKKIGYVKEHLERSCEELAAQEKKAEQSAAVEGPPLFLNFLSGSNFWRVGCWPEKIARVLNPAVLEHLAVEHKIVGGRASTGVVVLDFVGEDGDWGVVKLLVAMNAGLLVREGGQDGK